MEDRIYTCIKTLIGVGNTEDAQEMLDDIEDKDAQWHYLSSLLYCEKNWLNESRKQLEIAIELDPENENYKQELEDIKSTPKTKTAKKNPKWERENSAPSAAIVVRIVVSCVRTVALVVVKIRIWKRITNT